MSFLWGSEGRSSSTSTGSLPPYIEGPSAALVDHASGIMQQPYQAAPMPRVAELSPDQLAAMEATRGQQGMYQVPMDQAMMMTTGSTGAIGADQISQYQNPWVKNVADATAAEMERRSAIARLPMRRDATLGGAWGEARHGIQEAEYDRNLNMALANMYSDVYNKSWEGSLRAAEAEKARSLAGGQQLGQQAADRQNMAYKDIGSQMGIGALEQQQRQQNLDTAYGDWQRQQQWPYMQGEWMSKILGNLPYAASETRSTAGGKPGAANSILGLGGALINNWGTVKDIGSGIASLF